MGFINNTFDDIKGGCGCVFGIIIAFILILLVLGAIL